MKIGLFYKLYNKPDYFQNSEPPIIFYKYNKPIRNIILNFNKLVSDLDIDDS